MRSSEIAAVCLTLAILRIPAAAADEATTPAERHALGKSNGFGAAPAHDPKYCPAAAFPKVGLSAAKLVAPDKFLFRWSATLGATNLVTDFTAATYTTNVMVGPIDKAMSVLLRAGDQELKDRYVCVGLYDYGELNARAYSYGYILADTRLALKAQSRISDGTFVSDYPVLHELAHQFQFWTKDPTLAEPSMRHAELAADCVAAGLITLVHPRFLSFIESSDEVSASKLAKEFGDYAYFEKDHHGTPYERWEMIRDGIGLLKDWQARKGLKGSDYTGLSARLLLHRCNYLIGLRDKDQGPAWKPGWRGR